MKLIDAFATGTVPIDWGCSSIGDLFDLGAIIRFSSLRELSVILASLSEADHERQRPSIESDFLAAESYALVEDNFGTVASVAWRRGR